MSKGKQFGIIEPTERIRVRVEAIRETKITSTTSFSVLGYGVNDVIEVVETALPQAFSPDAEPGGTP